jgi:hypothetical protein
MDSESCSASKGIRNPLLALRACWESRMTPAISLPRCPVCGLEHAGELPGFCTRPSCGVELLPGSAERCRTRTFQLVEHYSLCILPFTFADGLTLPHRLTDAGRWKERTFSLKNTDDVDRTEYFLPYIRRFLFPSLFAKQAVEGEPEAKKPTCWHFDFDLTRLGPVGEKGLPLTLCGQDTRKKLPVEHSLLLESIQLIVFGYRVGFLIFNFRGAEPGSTYFDQMEALAYLRTIAPLYRGFEMPELVAGTTHYRMETLLPYLLAEFSPDGSPPSTPTAVALGTPLPVKPTYDDRMMVYAFSCLEKETALADTRRCESLLERNAVVNLDPKEVSRPPGETDAVVEGWLQSRWQSFTKDGGMLVVFNSDRYHSRFLGVYHGTYYFDIFLLSALQRVTLLALFDRFSDIQELITGSSASRNLLRRVRRDLLLFKNQCWFSQITNRERGLVLWKKWQKVFETRTLLREVNEQSEELNTYLQARYRERMEWLVRIGGFVAAAIPIIFGLDRFMGQQEWFANLRWVLLGSVILGAAVVAYLFVVRQSDEE